MKDETQIWLTYSAENLQAAKVLLESKLFNPCLQNVQQSVEKALKSLFAEFSILLKRTHSINELRMILKSNNLTVELSDEECDFLDSIYLPSKYPIGNALPDFMPDDNICSKSIHIAERILAEVEKFIKCK
jgi:HEPN domain-containing protein